MSRTDDPGTLPDVPSLRRSLLRWYRREARDLPWRRTRDPYAVWISEVMLQQTTVATVIPYYERFLSRFPDIASLAASDEEDLLALWSGLGYYRRARNLRAAARIIMERHDGRFPSSPEAIEALPGIGRYTAGAIASNCFGAALPAIDTNAARVVARVYAITQNGADGGGSKLGARGARNEPEEDGSGAPARGTRGEPPEGGRAGGRTAAIWRIAEALVPPESPGDWTQALMELGATVCRPATPDCGICPVAEECVAYASGDLAPYSLKRPRAAARIVHAALVVVARRKRILFVRRSADELLGGLWELPGTLAAALVASAHGASARAVSVRALSVRAVSARVVSAASARAASASTPAHLPASPESLRDLAGVLRHDLGFAPTGLARRARVQHTVTHRRLQIDVWTAAAPSTLPAHRRSTRGEDHLWADPASLASLPIGSASRKALHALHPPPARAR